MYLKRFLTLILVGYWNLSFAAEITSTQACLLQALENEANNGLTVAALKSLCTNQLADAAVPDFSEVEFTAPEAGLATSQRGFGSFFTPYKRNYILFGSMQNKNGGEPFSGKTLDIRFEFGMKFQVFQNSEDFDRLSPLNFGYSQKSWWDIAESSAPFKEHNYNPEIFWDFEDSRADHGLIPYQLSALVDRFGYEHQSNGRDGFFSRSWDRFYAQKTFTLPDQNLQLKLKAWNVVHKGDINKDITDYLGNGEAQLSYLAPSSRWEFSGTVIKGHETSKYSYRLDYVSDMSAWLNSRFMLSYYNGYGESLISYNVKTRSLRAGIYIPVVFD